jgi:hypothetical protein
MGLGIFSARVLNDRHITSRVQTALNDWLASEHESGYPPPFNTPTTIVDESFSISHNNNQGGMLIMRFVALVDQLNLYSEHFVQPYLEWVTTYYTEQHQNLGDTSRHSPTAIMNTCFRYLEEERVRSVTLMHPDSIISVEQTILTHFVAPMQEWLAEAGTHAVLPIRSGLTHRLL